MNLITPEFGLLFWQTITFLVLLLLLGRFAWKPIMSSLREREETIEGALRSAELARQEMTKLRADNERLLDEARAERDAMMRKAQQTADAIVEEAKNKAAAESNRIVESARTAIQSERQAAIDDIRRQVATLSVDIAEKVIRRQINGDTQQRQLVDQFVKDIHLS
ncbi:MAG: F0F1 ATP synthase subunit B [Cytophagales bacterium]|nr:F0F1 ATP synthase subunit B [Cytophagales bacterium]